MIEVIDLPSHRDGCTRCRLFALCPTGRRLAQAQATALLEMSGLTDARRWLRERGT